ncbi:MAG: PilC/PilY family type IV pilus protein [Moraxella sp.]|nr:PilC/PilY family type IV pilus protein [Moraxella sp.]
MNKTVKYLSAAVAVAMSTTAMQASADTQSGDYQKIGDLEIYKAATNSATISMMLDISGSMVNCDDGKGDSVRDFSSYQTFTMTDANGGKINSILDTETNKTIDISKGITVRVSHCGNPNQLTRMGRLKQAMVGLFADGTKLPSHYKVGLGIFPYTGNVTGVMKQPAKELTPEHRYQLIKQVAGLNQGGGTPSAHAYAEVGAYMMGTKTASRTGGSDFAYIPRAVATRDTAGTWQLQQCVEPADSVSAWHSSWRACRIQWPINVPNPQPSNWITNASFNYTPINDRSIYNIQGDFLADVQSAYAVINRGGVYSGGMQIDLVNGKIPSSANLDYQINTVWFGEKVRFAPTQTQTLVDHTTGTRHQSNYDGFRYAPDSTLKADKQTYQSPVDVGQCAGYGIYFLTDGEPNGNIVASQLMGSSLDYGALLDGPFQAKIGVSPNTSAAQALPWQNAKFSTDNTFQPSFPGYNGWPYIGAYAKMLASGNNPIGQKIKTATLGFGSVFDQDNVSTKPYLNSEGKIEEIIDCDTISGVDAKNLCRLGGKGFGFGEGGFTATSNPAVVAKSVVDFAEDLNNALPASPAGTMSIPRDPLSVDNIQPYGYLPMIRPEVGENLVTWEGNLKKYHTLSGTLYGQNNTRLYVPNPVNLATQGNGAFPAALNPQAMDLWQTGASQENNAAVDVGGTRSKLKVPTASKKSDIRTVYIEKLSRGSDGKISSELQKVGTDGTRLIGFDNLGDFYTTVHKAYILNFLGYGVPVTENRYIVQGQDNSPAAQTRRLLAELSRATLTARPTMGGVLHSVPVLASYAGKLDSATGNISTRESERQDHLLYGSMDGAVHMVAATSGEENFSFIPYAMFKDAEQVQALKAGSTYDRIGQPKFGVDAPWSTKAVYRFNSQGADTRMTATEMYAYGGLRMGGVGIYGLNISDRNNPRLMFSIDNQTRGFERLGQTWSKPLHATVQTGSKVTDKLDVLIFGGGYDMCYENPLFKLNDPSNTDVNCANKPQAQGNAVYMVNAKTGALLKAWTMPAGSATDDSVHMKHSITSEIVGLDRNNNGHVDSLYFGDLGGQLFRIDLQEGTAAGTTRRVVRVFDSNAGRSGTEKGSLEAGHVPFRFYEKPEISLYDHNNARLALVNIASGDRSSPTHKRRSLVGSNRIYGIIDRDLASSLVPSGASIASFKSRNLNNDDLNFYDTAVLETATNDKRKQLMDDLKAGKKQGWFYQMDNFDGRANIKHLKSVGPGMVLGGIYYASVYNPDYSYVATNSCNASVTGGTERQMFCLPWGICANNNGVLTPGSTNGKLGYAKAGPGIQELALTGVTSRDNPTANIRALIGMQTIAERRQQVDTPDNSGSGGNAFTDQNNQGTRGAGSGADKPHADVAVQNSQVLQVKRWYDLQTAEEN